MLHCGMCVKVCCLSVWVGKDCENIFIPLRRQSFTICEVSSLIFSVVCVCGSLITCVTLTCGLSLSTSRCISSGVCSVMWASACVMMSVLLACSSGGSCISNFWSANRFLFVAVQMSSVVVSSEMSMNACWRVMSFWMKMWCVARISQISLIRSLHPLEGCKFRTLILPISSVWSSSARLACR